MKTTMQPRRRYTRALGRLMGAVLGVWTLGAVYTPAVAATNVTVDQQPLTLQPVIPPNITLMLDDSGSMNWDFMPDASYLTGNFTATDEGQPVCGDYQTSPCIDVYVPMDALRSSGVNGTYYDPSITYNAPVHADGSSYLTPTTLGGAYLNPFNSTSSPVDVTQYHSPWLCDYNPVNANWSYSTNQNTLDTHPCPDSLYYAFPYYTAFPTSGNATAPTPTCQGNDTIDKTTGMCGVSGSEYVPAYSCNSSGTATNQYDPATGYCDNNGVTYVYLFTYTTVDSTTGNYVRHYVGKGTDCSTATASSAWPSGATCVAESDTTGLAAPNNVSAGQNIATWFSYYRKRIYMAKSGLMTAFSTVDPKFRVGFGSINNHGSSTITALGSGNYNTYNGRYIAYVQPFGSGTSGSQKSNFWNWVSGLSAGNSTPLRTALDAVGQYYSDTDTSSPSSNAWDTMSSDPGYVAGGTNSPIACRQSYTILTTDGFWNSNYSSSATLHASDKTGPAMTGPNGATFQYSPAAPYSGGDAVDAYGNATPSLADVAMYYWETDLQTGTGFSNEVPANKQDPAFWQHMTTFTMGLGFQPTGISGTAPNNDNPPTTADIAKWVNDGGSATSQYAINGLTWPQPSAANGGSINNIADLEHAGVNGHGGFYSATNPTTFTSGLQDALKRALTRSGTGASLAANSTQLNNGTVAYQAKYLTAVWSGDLLALPINSSTGAIASPTNASWSAVTKFPSAASRTIVTYNPSGTGTTMWPAFQNDATTGAPPSLSAAEQAALGSTATAQAAMVNYLRGDSTQEGTTYRSRTTPLGDIVDSQPVYSGAPNSNEFVGETFTGISNPTSSTNCDASFAGFAGGDAGATGAAAACYDATSRTPLVFVAANDGMLHAFNASTGTEVYAYLPGAVITGDVAVNSAATSPTFDNTALATLANPNYGSATGSTPHQFYNDGELTIADVYFGAAWHTVLVGTTGRGPAEAVYALDITKATVNATTGAISGITPLWERSARDGLSNSNYIGQMVGKPVIAKVQDGSTNNSDWQVLIGNGYNSASGQAALLEFNVYNGTLTVHTTTSITSTAGNGLAAPVVWMNDPTSGISTQAYAGDLQGQVWYFPLSVASTSKSGGTTTTTYTTVPSPLGGTIAPGASNGGTVIFTTPSQPITAGMLAGRDPKTGNVWLFFGTGQYLSSADLGNKQVQSWYGVIAQSSSGTVTSGATQSSLVQRAITYELDGNPSANPPTLGLRTVTPTPTTSDMSGKLGWYMNLEAPTGASGALVAQGERMVTPNQFQANLLLGTTRIPVVTDICNPSGSGWVMAVNPFTGTNPSAAFFLANGGSGMVSITNSDGTTSTVPAAGVGFSSLPNNPIFVGGDMLMSFDNGTTTHLNTTGSTAGMTRVSWQELVNP